jgi:FkbM family methyltransferase
MLKYLRSIALINKFVRRSIVTARRLVVLLEKRWRVSGVMKLELDGLEFLMVARGDDGIADRLYYGNGYEEANDLVVFKRLIRKNDVIFDIGANTGVYSLVAGTVSKESRIFSFEPNPFNIARLNQNIDVNQLQNVTVVPMAVGADAGKVSFTIPLVPGITDTSSVIESFSRASYQGKLAWRNIEVDQVSVDLYCMVNRIEVVHLLKIDVEGYEVELLNGAKQTIAAHRPVILIETFLGGGRRPYFENFVSENNYTIYIIVSGGIVKIGKTFEAKSGLNYLLLGFETEKTFTLAADLRELIR